MAINCDARVWNHDDRNDFIRRAVNSDQVHGHDGPYHFNTYPKSNGLEKEDPRRALATHVLAKTIYETNPMFRKIPLAFYNTLCQKIGQHPILGYHLGKDVVVVMKGGNAYAYATREEFPEDFSFSDLDIVIYINPYMDPEFFKHLEKNTRIVVLQTISQYKRMLDNVLFLNRAAGDDFFLDETVLVEFKETMERNCEEAGFISPFSSTEVRNKCSRHSFIITNSVADKSRVVMVELPHFDRCERIPLRKTPLFCSFNQTINFDRTEECRGEFDLYRIRMNILSQEKDDDGNVVKEEKVPCDMIDVTIAAQTDAELIDFWKHGRCLYVYEKHANIWINVPDIQTCIGDLYKMLHVYECPESKREKREKKYKKMMELVASR